MSALGAYRALTTALAPLVMLYLFRRLAAGKEDRARFAERRGIASRARPRGPVVWVHAASVGEAVSMLALIDALVADRPSVSVLVTTGTVTSARLLATRLPEGRAWHQYVPVDRPAYVRRFLDHWQPDLALWVESELWPNLILETKARGVPLVLVNGRMSERSFEGWQRWPSVIRPLLGAFELCLGQDAAQAERLRQLGAGRSLCVGNLKAAAGPLPVNEAELARLAGQAAGRPLWLAASTHAGEEDAAAAAHQILKQRWPDLLTLIVPRHPGRAGAIAAMLESRALKVARRSRAEPIAAETDIYLGDTLGELGIFYRLAGIAFVGGSLVPIGGHDPTEPAALGKPVVFGPHMENAREAADLLLKFGCARIVKGKNDLFDVLCYALSNKAALAEKGRLCREAILSVSGTSKKIAQTLIGDTK